MKALKIPSKNEVREDMGSTETLAEPLSPSAVVHVRSYSSHILVTIGLHIPTDVDTFRAQLPSALNHPRFSSLLVGDEEKKEDLKWVQIPHLNIDDHIIVPKINYPSLANNRLAGDNYVENYLHNLTKTSLDTSKPLWEVHLLDVKTSQSESIWILRIHHAFGDGVSITSHILAMTRQVSKPDSLPTISGMKTKTNTKENDHKYNFVLMAWWWLKAILNTIADVSKVFPIIFFKDTEILTMSSLDTGSNQRHIAYKILDLDDIKFIKNAMKVTVNDVVLGILEAGFSRTLNRRFGNGKKENMKATNMLDKVSVKMAMAVNLRPIQGVEGLEDIKNKDTKLGLSNEIGFIVMPLSMVLRDDPLEYVRKAKSAVDRKKHSFEGKVNINLCKLAVGFIGFKAVGLVTAKIFNHLSIFISNVPGPMEEIHAFGHTIKFIAPTVYGLPSPIMMHFQSCTNKMAITVAVREDVIIDPHEIVDDIEESLLLIKAALIK